MVTARPLISLRTFWISIVIIAIVMFALRASQITHGQPGVVMSDENSDLSTTAHMLNGEAAANVVNYGDVVVPLRYARGVMWSAETVAFAGVYVFNAFKTGNFAPSALRDLYFSHQSYFVISARLLAVIISVIALFFLADLVRRLTSPLGGIIVALLMCFYYLFNVHTIYAMPDSLTPSAIIFFLWAANYLCEKGTTLSYALAGFFYAFMILAKLSLGPIGIVLALAHGWRVWTTVSHRQFLRRFIFSKYVGIAIISFIIGNVLLNLNAFLHPHDLFLEFFVLTRFAGITYGGDATITNSASSVVIYKTLLVINSYLGIPLLIAIVVGIITIFVRHTAKLLILFVSFFMMWLELSAQRSDHFPPSYWAALLPAIVTLAALGLVGFLDFASKQHQIIRVVAIVCVIAIIANEAYYTLRMATVMWRQNTLLEARDYIEQNWANDTKILMGTTITYSVPLSHDPQSVQRLGQMGAAVPLSFTWWAKQPPQARQYEYNIFGPEYQSDLNTYDSVITFSKEQNIQYIIESDYCGGQARPDSISAIEFPALNPTTRSQLKLVKIFSPFQSDECLTDIYDRTSILLRSDVNLFYRPGPVVRIYEVEPATLTF